MRAPLALVFALFVVFAFFPTRAGAEDRPESRPTENGPPVDTAAERPFVHGRRPRADGAVQAAVEDEALARWNVGGSSDPKCASNRRGFHVAPRVKVDVDVKSGKLPPKSAKKGVLSELAVLSQTRNHGYWPLRLCYQEGLLAAPKLAGKTRVRLSIDRSGHARKAHVVDTELRDREVASCVATKLGALSFSPAPASRAEIEVTVDLNPGDAVLPDTCTSEDAEPSSEALPNGLSKNLEERLPQVAACYEEGRAKDPALWGRIAFELEVSADGRVQRVTQHDSRFPDPTVVACGARALSDLRFSPFGEGATRVVWGVRFGKDPSQTPVSEAGNPAGSGGAKSLVAEPTPTRLPLAP